MTDLLNVDLTRATVTREPLSAELEPLGGHGLTSAIVNQEVNPEADPLGPGNVLVIACRHLRGHERAERRPAVRGRQEPAHRRHQGGQLRRLGGACAGRAGPARHQGHRPGGGAVGARRDRRRRQARRRAGAPGAGLVRHGRPPVEAVRRQGLAHLHRPRRRDGREGRRRARHHVRPLHARRGPRGPRFRDGVQEAQGRSSSTAPADPASALPIRRRSRRPQRRSRRASTPIRPWLLWKRSGLPSWST